MFVAGCPRTGTSVLSLLLGEHPSVALGFERFKRVRNVLEPFHFEPAVFCNPVPSETDIFVPGFYEHLARKLERGGVTVIGDKVPLYTDSLEHLRTTFPGCRVVITVRELEPTAASFRERATDPGDTWAAANDHLAAAYFWNGALHAARDFELAGHGDQLLLLPYDELFDGERVWLEMLLEFLELPSSPSFTRAWEEAVVTARARARAIERRLPPGIREAVLAEGDEELDQWWRARIEQQARNFRGRLRDSGDQPTTEPDTTIPMPPEVRTELLKALKAAPRPADELSELERRVAAQMRELSERGRKLTSLQASLESVRDELEAATGARSALLLEVQELAAQSLATRERLTAQLADAAAEIEAARGASVGAVHEREQELADARAALEQERADEREAAGREREAAGREREAAGREREAAGLERDRLAAEIRMLKTERTELEHRLAIRSEELDVAVRQLTEVERTVAGLQSAVAEVRAETEASREVRDAETKAAHEERAGLLSRLDEAMFQNDGMARTLADRDRAEAALRAEISALHTELGGLRASAELARRLQAEREQTLEDVRRAASSRAWKLGHGTTRLLRRLTFRRMRTRGALQAIIDRLEKPQLPPGESETPPSQAR